MIMEGFIVQRNDSVSQATKNGDECKSAGYGSRTSDRSLEHESSNKEIIKRPATISDHGNEAGAHYSELFDLDDSTLMLI